ncbi:hypothetical protein HK100_001300, partial [Physocladia obscura]
MPQSANGGPVGSFSTAISNSNNIGSNNSSNNNNSMVAASQKDLEAALAGVVKKLKSTHNSTRLSTLTKEERKLKARIARIQDEQGPFKGRPKRTTEVLSRFGFNV